MKSLTSKFELKSRTQLRKVDFASCHKREGNAWQVCARCFLRIVLLLFCPSLAIGGSATFSNGTDLNIPDGTGIYVHSPVTFSGAPSGVTVTRIDYSFSITHPYGGDLDVDLNDQTRTTAYKADLWRGTLAGGTDSGVNPTRSGSITSGPLIGLPVNQTWYLAAADVDIGSVGYINTWTITVYWADSQPNLTPYQPSGWSGKIVVSRTSGNNTDSTSLTTADTLYIDWAVINNGSAAVGSTFYTYLYVDGAYWTSWYTSPPLNASTYTTVADYVVGSLTAGTHTIAITTDATGVISESSEADNSYTKTISVGNVTQPNLTPYQPPAWSDKIVVSRATGNNTDSTSLTTADTLYLDWAVINNGTAAAANTLYTYLYVDGVSTYYWSTTPPLNANIYTTVADYVLGSLTAGTHTLRITADATGVISESSEADNSYTKTISVGNVTQPNLTPYQPPGWSDKVVVSRAPGNNTDSTALTTPDTLYIDWAVINNGAAAAGALFYTQVYVDGVLTYTWNTIPPLGTQIYSTVFDYSIGSLAFGTHTIRIKTDSTGVIGESNEGDNEYTKTITIANGNQPNLTPYQPSSWSDKIVVSRAAGNNTDSTSLSTADTLYVDWAVLNNGNVAVGSTFYTYLYVDDVFKYSWYTSPPLNANYYAAAFDYSIGSLSAGPHTIKITTDATGVITEGSEADNSYTKNINVGGTAVPDFIINGITLSPTVPQPGQAFTATVTVKNQGLASGDGKWLDVWANQSSVPACGTDGNTWATVGVLSQNQIKPFTLNLTAPATAGSYTLRAFVDSYCQTAEANDGNNQTPLTYTVGSVSPTPNFVVTTITFNPAQPVGGQPFAAYVTVKNQGTVSGDGKYLDVWVNQPSPQACGAPGNQNQSVGTLAVNQTKMLTFNLTAPPSGGPWAFRAFVDSTCQTTESNESDNQMTVSYGINPVALPDFRITSISTSPGPTANFPPGAPFTAYITVTNQGAGPGDAGTLSVWANKPTAANCGELGDQFPKVGVLAAGASKTITVSLTAVPDIVDAVNTLRAFADSGCGTTESNEANNQFTSTYAPAVEVWSLTVAAQVGVTPTTAQWTSVSNNFKLAANYLCDATDGQFRLGNIFFYNAGAQTAYADVKVELMTELNAYSGLSAHYVVLGITAPSSPAPPDYFHNYKAITHELGHAQFGLGDEYTAYQKCANLSHWRILGSDHDYGDMVNSNKGGHSDLARTCPACIMENPTTSEFCIHNDQINNHNSAIPENHQQTLNHQSCWETILANTTAQVKMPSAAPLPGPCSTTGDSTIPLGADAGVAVFVNITGP